ncbi:MAG: AmmeMemoRadiSam system radical SAM enzyme [Thermoplasmata archaeon HGW-Thermoplasmata-1]|nr:MAG: AmmeMemoRadiSam system radical SAM enzyme [Thermoplasmata archaeon HGW-Thermoplasmata-1]
MLKKAMHWESTEEKEDKKVRCLLCAHNCVIAPGKCGICGVRENRDGELYSLIYGLASSVGVDPIEKKPLFHFHPGSRVLSFGTAGCNFRCPHCQNWEISQCGPEELRLQEIMPAEAVEMAKRHRCEGMAWTYNEPAIWHEYALDSMKLAKEAGLYTVYVTNGYINEKPLREIAPYLDAANVDVKGFSDEFYKEIAGARLMPVLKTCKLMKELNIHLEVTYLVIPTKNDSADEMRRFCEWVANELGTEVPVHFSAFHPDYKLASLPITPSGKLKEAHEIGRAAGLKYLYLGNAALRGFGDTVCPKCGNTLIERSGFSVRVLGGIKNGRCLACNRRIPVIGV